MKATKLMVGDWVLDGKKPAQITGIMCDDLFETTISPSVGGECISPIPLTPEILEKNGFELKSDGWLWCEDKDVETQNYSFVQFRRDREVRIVEINFLNKAVAKFRNVQYVHELQHALRLCGIDKEIEI